MPRKPPTAQTTGPVGRDDVLAELRRVVDEAGLGPDAVGALIAGVVGEQRAAEVAAGVHRRTGGNPFFVQQVSWLLHSGQDGIPPGVHQALELRFAALPAAAATTLRTAAVIGQRFSADLAARAAGQPPGAVAEALAAAVRARVVSRDGTDSYRFAHDLFREYAYDQLPAAERASLHQQIGQALQASRAGDQEILLEARLLAATDRLELADPGFRAELDEFIRLAEASRQPRFRYAALVRRAALALLAGRLAEAERLIGQAEMLGEECGEPGVRDVRYDQGWDLLTAQGRLGELGGTLPQMFPDPDSAQARGSRALVMLASGARAEAASAVAPLLKAGPETIPSNHQRLPSLADLRLGADEVLDATARRQIRARLASLGEDIAEAESWNDPERAARARAERDALLRELTAAAGPAGQPRLLGDQSERARKAVTARIRDVIARIEQVHPGLAGHLRESVTTGTRCSYSPPTPVRWRL